VNVLKKEKTYEKISLEAKQAFLSKYPDYQGNAWTTEEAEREFEFTSFSMGFAFVIRRSNGGKFSLNFTNEFGARVYFDLR